jgi:hypothetical protein
MSQSRNRNKEIKKYNTHTTGCFGQYACTDTLPIEFISTTFNMDDLAKLTYAENIRTELDFQLLIQRDIDKERAVDEISTYISPDNGSGYGSSKNNGVFLPPLVVAIVDTKDGKTLCEHYPNMTSSSYDDEYGVVFEREWKDLFKIKLFEQKGGASIYLSNDKETKPNDINIKNCEIDLYLGQKDEKGGRLVVIDGQHRLYALNYLRKHDEHKEKIKDLIIPVCIIYSPTSTEINVQNLTPSIPDVLRKLFVDVNNNAKTVSGHFRILLSDDDIGKVACGSLCSSLLDKEFYDGKSLSLVEWNTKNNKESKTISKPYSLTSIGVVYDSLCDLFSTKNGKDVLRYILRLDEINSKLDFGLDSDGEKRKPSSDFPWRDIPYNNKEDIKAQVDKYLTPCIKKIFFSTPAYKNIIDIFFTKRKDDLEVLKNSRSNDSSNAKAVLEHLDEFSDLSTTASKDLLSKFITEFTDAVNNVSPPIIRNNVFQKAVLTAWFNFIQKLAELNVDPKDATSIFILVLQNSLDSELFDNTIAKTFLQDSVFEGIRIRVSKESRLQVSRLILSTLGNHDFSNKISTDLINLDDTLINMDLVNILQKFGENHTTYFTNTLHSQRVKIFAKNYRSNTELTSFQIQELMKLEESKNLSKEAKKKDKTVEIDELFELKVKEFINVDFEVALSQLEFSLGFTPICDELMRDENSEDESC